MQIWVNTDLCDFEMGRGVLEFIVFLFILKSDHFFRIPKNKLRKQIAKVSIINYIQLSYNSTITEKQALHYLV